VRGIPARLKDAEMDWVLLSLVSAVAFTVVTLVQKRTLDSHVRSVVAFNASAAVLQVSVALVIIILAPPDDWFTSAVAIMVIVGVLQAAVWFLQSYAISRETDISRIVPVLDSFPLLVLLIAVVFLGESLTPLKWIAMFLVTGGAILASWHQAKPGEPVRLNRSFFAIVGAVIAMSLMAVLFKVASASLSVGQMLALAWLCAAPVHFAVMRLTHEGVENVVAVFRSRTAFSWVGLTQLGMLIAISSALMALTLGPVSLSTAIMSTRPVLLMLWAVASGISLKHVITAGANRGPIRLRMASASLVSLGVGAMAF
jgi:drug/metabolite transporter (DMT)-like permease